MSKQKTTPRSKKGGLNSKHLLIGLFAVAVGAVCGAVIGLMQTSVHTDTHNRAAAPVAGSTVEVWAPRGASAPAVSVRPAQSVQMHEQEQNSEEIAQASAPDAPAEAEAASSPVAVEKPQKTTQRAQRKKAPQKKAVEAETPVAAQAVEASPLPAVKAPDTSVTAAKSAEDAPAAPPKPPVAEPPAVAKEPPREPPKAVVTDNLF